ncbi:MAG: beta-lactamase hydrolase domain-containing protein [Leptodesmis sp.]|uniref:beta-lactamase hydrolase domain-containing protein n=1 Tax=Leptodesmis sp. TaxID=3100501 RepID=UPI003D0A7513
MARVRKITDDLAIAGQLTLEEFEQLVEEGYRSVVNLRSPDETGFLRSEQQILEQFGIFYLSHPTTLGDIHPDFIRTLIQQIIKLPQPIIFHCDSGTRSAILALLYIAMKQGMKTEQAFQKVTELGLL